MSTQTTLYRTGNPYICLRAGIYWFLPWLEPMPSRGLVWKNTGLWRTLGGALWTTEQVQAWADERNWVVRNFYYTPKLIDEDAIAWEDEVLYASNE